jgi:PAS domain S-box-containing protein
MRKVLLITITCICVAILILIDRWQVKRWRAEKALELRATSQLCQHRLENAIDSRFKAVESLAALFSLHPETKPEEFAQFASLLLQFNPPIRALQYADSKTRVIYVYPPKGNEITISNPMQLITDHKRGSYVKKAIARKSAVLQGPFELRQGGKGVVVRFPIFISERFIGLSIGVYDVPSLIQEAFSGIDLNQFVFRITDAEGRIFLGPDKLSHDFQEQSVTLADTKWTLTLSWMESPSNPPILIRMLIWVCGCGFLLSVLMLIRLSWIQEQRLKEIVDERTLELSNSNQSLLHKFNEQRQTEEELRKSEETYRLLADNISDNLWVLDLNTLKFTYISPSVIKLSGFTSDETLKISLQDLLTPSSMELAMSVLTEELEDENRNPTPLRSRTLELEQYCKDGTTVWTEAAMRLIHDNEGRPVSVLGVTRNISERKQAEKERRKLEAQLQQAYKMEAIGTLTGGVAHDFNNILSIIIGNTELALDDIPKNNPASLCLENINTASHRAAEIVKQLLNYSRKTDHTLQPVNIVSVIKDALKFLRSTIPTNIKFKKNIQHTSINVLADPVQIHQVMMNLCVNAYHEMEDAGGTLGVTIKNKVLDEKEANSYPELTKGDYVELMVSDTGPGIDPGIIYRIFDPYYTTKEVGKGSGMGLAVVHGIVKNHNGFVTATSKLGKGSTFTILLPVIKEKPESKIEKTDELPPGNEKILFIDDEEAIVNIIQKILERLGYKVEALRNPLEALQLFQSKPDKFDLVITDTTMPQMTGVDLSEKLRNIRPDIPIIICTGHSDLIDKTKAKKIGLNAYVMKPIMKQDIANTIRNVLDT